MPIPVSQTDCSPTSASDGSPTKDKVSRWRQTLLSSWPRDRTKACAAASAAKDVVACDAKDPFEGWWLAPHTAKKRSRGDCETASRCCRKDSSGSDAEEENWELHRQMTGLVAKLVVFDSSDRLMADFQLRPGLRKSGAVVLNVLPGGLCDRAGVRAGDRLVSVNGRQDQNFKNLRVEEVPTKLIFMGTSGKITTEVRLISGNTSSNVSFNMLSDKVWGGAKTKYLFQEERVFVPSVASLALGVQAEPSKAPQMFSLEPREASNLLRRAKSEAEAQLCLGDRTCEGAISHGSLEEGQVDREIQPQQELWVEVGEESQHGIAGHSSTEPKKERHDLEGSESEEEMEEEQV